MVIKCLPFAVAHNVGELSSDVIVSFGDDEFSTLAEFVNNFEYNKEVEVSVRRNNTFIKLKATYDRLLFLKLYTE
jgi:hypothetical protein